VTAVTALFQVAAVLSVIAESDATVFDFKLFNSSYMNIIPLWTLKS
jgi:hypothetical protein